MRASNRSVRRSARRPSGRGNYAGVVTIPTLEELHARGPLQQPTWPDPAALDDAVRELRAKPPLVFAGECDDLKANLAKVAAGEAFLLQGGDCAETFEGVTAENVRAKLQVLLQMAVVLTYGASVPVVKVGRIAGQYAKPRSATPRFARASSCRRTAAMLSTASSSPRPAAVPTLRDWCRSTTRRRRRSTSAGPSCRAGSPTCGRCTRGTRTSSVPARSVRSTSGLSGDIERALNFMKAIGAESEELHRVGFHSSHEALILEYEHALTRIDSRTQSPYDVSGHFLWIGERTRQLDGPHVELMAAVRNPIGVKLGPTATPDEAVALAAEAQPGQRTRAAHVHHPDGRGQGPRPAADPGREGDGGRGRGRRGSPTRCTATRSRPRPATRRAGSTT